MEGTHTVLKDYEVVFIVRIEGTDDQINEVVEQAKGYVEQDGVSKVNRIDRWGRRKLAYEIRKRKEGIYTLIRFTAGPNVLQSVNRRYQLNENLLRHLTVLYEAPPPAPAGTEGLPQDVDAESPAIG